MTVHIIEKSEDYEKIIDECRESGRHILVNPYLGEFNATLFDAEFIFFDLLGLSAEQWPRLKRLVYSKRIRKNQKYRPPVTVENTLRLILYPGTHRNKLRLGSDFDILTPDTFSGLYG